MTQKNHYKIAWRDMKNNTNDKSIFELLEELIEVCDKTIEENNEKEKN